eukprot:scaffold13401_cov57-Phaeocystis_antarctica.AAC.1
MTFFILVSPERPDSGPVAAPDGPSLLPTGASAAPRYVRNAGYAWGTRTDPQMPRRVPGASR